MTNLDETKTNFLLEVETMRNDGKNRWNVQRKLQDFYLLERKLTEFHGVFSDARLPPRRSLKNVEILKDFQHFLRVKNFFVLFWSIVKTKRLVFSAFVVETNASTQRIIVQFSQSTR